MSTFTMVLTEDQEKEFVELTKRDDSKKSIILESLRLRDVISRELKEPDHVLAIIKNGKIIKEIILI